MSLPSGGAAKVYQTNSSRSHDLNNEYLLLAVKNELNKRRKREKS
jgi:hypothetical protein